MDEDRLADVSQQDHANPGSVTLLVLAQEAQCLIEVCQTRRGQSQALQESEVAFDLAETEDGAGQPSGGSHANGNRLAMRKFCHPLDRMPDGVPVVEHHPHSPLEWVCGHDVYFDADCGWND